MSANEFAEGQRIVLSDQSVQEWLDYTGIIKFRYEDGDYAVTITDPRAWFAGDLLKFRPDELKAAA